MKQTEVKFNSLIILSLRQFFDNLKQGCLPSGVCENPNVKPLHSKGPDCLLVGDKKPKTEGVSTS